MSTYMDCSVTFSNFEFCFSLWKITTTSSWIVISDYFIKLLHFLLCSPIYIAVQAAVSRDCHKPATQKTKRIYTAQVHMLPRQYTTLSNKISLYSDQYPHIYLINCVRSNSKLTTATLACAAEVVDNARKFIDSEKLKACLWCEKTGVNKYFAIPDICTKGIIIIINEYLSDISIVDKNYNKNFTNITITLWLPVRNVGFVIIIQIPITSKPI